MKFIAPIVVYPGEDEMLTLTQGVFRILTGENKLENIFDFAQYRYDKKSGFLGIRSFVCLLYGVLIHIIVLLKEKVDNDCE